MSAFIHNAFLDFDFVELRFGSFIASYTKACLSGRPSPKARQTGERRKSITPIRVWGK